MLVNLMITAFIILCCIFGSKVSAKFGLPTLLLFILLGFVFGSDGFFKIKFDNYSFAEELSSAALLIIIFYGGFGTKWRKAKKAAGRSVLLSSAGTILTGGLVGTFCTFVMGFEPLEGYLLGAVIGSTDAASVFAILRSKQLNLRYSSAPILELESGSNDPFAYMMTVVILTIMKGDESENFVLAFVKQLGFGLLFGAVFAFLGIYALKHIKFEDKGFDAIFVCAIAILSYAVPSVVGGNGYLSAYIAGIALGNAEIEGKKALVNFFDGITGITQIMLFFMLGLLAFPSQIPKIILPAALIALFQILIARPAVVFALLKPFKAPLNQIGLISFAGIRGASSIVFAIMVTADEAYMSNDIFHIVFMIVLISITLQGSLLPFVARKFNMIDEGENVMKTFNDYSDENTVQFIRVKIDEKSPWANQKIMDITLPKGLLIALIRREVPVPPDESVANIRGKRRHALLPPETKMTRVVPHGNTEIFPGDELVISGVVFYDDKKRLFTEVTIDAKDSGKSISELGLPHGDLIIMVKRGSEILMPTGGLVLLEEDVIVKTITAKKQKTS